MMVKKHPNDTNCMLQKSDRSRPFVVHVHQMWHFYSDLLKDEVQDPLRISTTPDSLPQRTKADKLAPVDVA